MYLLAKELAKDPSYDVWFVVGDSGQERKQVIDGVKVVVGFDFLKRKKGFQSLRFVRAPRREWKFFNALRKIDASVYIQSAAGVITATVALAARSRQKGFIYRVVCDNDSNGKFIKDDFVQGSAYRLGLSLADAVVVQNRGQLNALRDNHDITGIMIGNAHNMERLSPFPDKDISLLWVARCDKMKRPEIFLDIVRRFPNEKCVMIAPKQDNYPDLFDRIRKDSEKLKNLEFIESVPFDRIQSYFDRARVFVGTSDFEGFPNTYLQACMGATPIASLRIDPNEFITRNESGMVFDGNRELMINGIGSMIRDRTLLKRLSLNARKYVEREHDIKNVIKDWKSLIGRVISRG